jgi:hypothetical protein
MPLLLLPLLLLLLARVPTARASATAPAACTACPPSSAGAMCRISCPSDLDQEGPGTGHCVRCPTAAAIPTGVAVVDVTLPADPASTLTTLQLGINSPGGTYCPCNIAKGCKAPLNATTDLLRLRPQFIRTHDVSLLNPSTFSISPPNPLGTPTLNWADLFPSLAADPSLPASYNFTSADAWAAEFDALGIPLLMRLGTGWFSPPSMTAVPQSKAETLAEAFLHFAMHFNDGWGGGRQPTASQKIKYWEVWNEPEGSRFWTGNTSAFHDILALTVQKLRKYDPSLRVGPNNACPGAPECTSGMRPGFELAALDNTLSRGIRPNLYSWHEYIVENPTLTVPIYRWTAQQLAARNLSDVEQIITEWNPCGSGACVPPYQTDAWAACDFAQTVLTHATLGVTMTAPYPLCATNTDWGLISTETVPTGALTWRPQAFAFQMMAEVLRAAPYVAQDTTVRPWESSPTEPHEPRMNQSDSKYFAAGFTNGNRSTVSVVFVARMQPSDDPTAVPPITQQEVLVTVRGVKPSTGYLASAFAIDMNRSNTAVGGPPVVVVSDVQGTLHLPHSYGSITPRVLHVKLDQQQ